MIKVKLYGILKKYMPETDEDGFWCVEQDGLTVSQILDLANVPQEERRATYLVNKMRKDEQFVLHSGDSVQVMPLIAGG